MMKNSNLPSEEKLFEGNEGIYGLVLGKRKSEEDNEMIKPRRITELDMNQAFTIGDVQPVSSVHEEMEQTEI